MPDYSKASQHERDMAQTQMQALYEGVTQDYAIFTLDPQGYITTWNDGAIRMKQYTPDEVIGRHYSMLYPEDANRNDEPMEHLRTAAREGRFRGVGTRIRKSGEPFIADVLITPMYRDEKLVGFSKVVSDVTAQGRLIHDQEQQVFNLKLEQELRDRFVFTLSHDLRNPLTAALVGLELIASTSCDQEEHKRLAEIGLRALSRADRMITDLLDVSRIRAHEQVALEVEKVDLTKLLTESLAELATVYGNRFRFDAATSTIGYWDPTALRRVIENTATNAVKYGDPTEPITYALKSEGEEVILTVHNAGEPIETEDQKNLFSLFRRSTAAKGGKSKGWGIGLTLVHGMVEAHGGSVEVSSRAGEGTTFTIRLPVDSRVHREHTEPKISA